ncbi:MAG: histidine phosphatase family protein [Geodermatophilaceae bacterium]
MSEDESTPGRLLLLRHGETDWSAGSRHTGRTDVPLNDVGERQAAVLDRLLARFPPATVRVSPLQRAERTAELAGLSGFRTDADLVEWDYGKYDGLTREQVREVDPDWTIWTAPTPSGETRDEVMARARRVLDGIQGDLTTGDVLLVGHGHFSRVLAVAWLGLALETAAVLHLAAAALSVLGDDRGQPIIEHWNLTDDGGDKDR